MSMTPEQLQMMQQQMQGQPMEQDTPEQVRGLLGQQPQNPLVGEQEQPEPLEALKEVAFLACDVFTQFANDKKLDVNTKASALSQMSQVIGNVFGQLNQPDPSQDLQFKVAEFQMNAQEKQLDMQMKKEEFELKRAEAQLQLQAKQAEANVKHVESSMKIQNKQEEHSLNMEQKEKENQMNIIHKQQGHEQSLQQKKDQATQTGSPKPRKEPRN